MRVYKLYLITLEVLIHAHSHYLILLSCLFISLTDCSLTNRSIDQGGPESLVSVSDACCMDAFFWDTNKCTGYFSAVGIRPVKFFGDHRSKTKSAKDLLMWFASPIANQDILNQSCKMFFKLWAKRYFQWTQKLVHLYCYDSFDN